MKRYLSVCSGIEAASVAWEPLGWTPVGFAEIERFPSRVLAHHYGSNMPGEPLSSNGVPNFGDFTAIDTTALGAVDLLVGGTPCQAFSVAGKRLSLADARGNLSLAFTVLAHELARSHGLRWVVWENVPGVLSTDDNAFGCFLGGLVGADDPVPLPRGAERWPDAGLVAGPRARAAWRILDAQYFGLAQRRRRVFVVAGFGDGADPAAVLFEPAGLRRHPPSRGEAGEGVAGKLTSSLGRRGGLPNDDNPADYLIAGCLNGHGEYGADLPALRAKGGDAGGGSEALLAFGGNNTSGPIDVATAVNAHGGPNGRQDFESETFVTHALRAEGFDASEDGTGRGIPLVPVAFDCKAGGDTGFSIGELPGALRGAGHGGGHSAVAFDLRGREGGAQLEGPHDTANIRAASGGSSRSYVATDWAVRRLMPVETERLQGFPDNHTAIPGAADGPRYKTHGNSMAVNVMRWIGERIDAAERVSIAREAAE